MSFCIARFDRYDDETITTTWNLKDCKLYTPKENGLTTFPKYDSRERIQNRVFIVCSKTTKKIISDATQTPHEEARTLLMAASILRRTAFDHYSAFSFDGSFPDIFEESPVSHRMKYFFRQLLTGLKSSSGQENSRKIISVCQIAMLNI